MFGRVLWFDDNKGYGFIGSSDASCDIKEDIFFHYSEIKTEESFKTLMYGQPVEFDMQTTGTAKDRVIAVNIKPMPFINENTNKPFLLTSFVEFTDESPLGCTLQEFQTVIGSKEKKGIKHIFSYPSSGMLLGLSRPASDFNGQELSRIAETILDNRYRKIIETGDWLSYDILQV
ncbi:MAG: Cold shock protein [Herbinix sp.]|jgi:cold shock CspA family protein|nr:Cold shock protein [Herbinix sp.]